MTHVRTKDGTFSTAERAQAVVAEAAGRNRRSLPGWASGVHFWVLRGGAAELMQHGLAPVRGRERRGEWEGKRTEEKLTEFGGTACRGDIIGCCWLFVLFPYSSLCSFLVQHPKGSRKKLSLDSSGLFPWVLFTICHWSRGKYPM